MVSPQVADQPVASELRKVVGSQLQILIDQNNLEGAKSLLIPVKSVDIAEAIYGLPPSRRLVTFRLLPKDRAVEVYEYCSPEVQESLIQEFQDQEILNIVDGMSPDDRAGLFDELPPQLVKRVLTQLTPEERQATALLLGYPPETAGRLMTLEYIALEDGLTTALATERVRELSREREVSYYVYAVDADQTLTGVLSLRDLLLADPEQTISEVMDQHVIFAQTSTDQEEVARLIQRYDLLALPVVNQERKLVGVVTVDDAIDILQTETTEDIYTMGAVQTEGDDYFQSSLLSITRKRLPWLSVLLITNILTIFVMSNFEEILDEVVALAFFTPLLIDTGGNIGAQSSTVVIRGLGTEDLKHKKKGWVIFRESLAGGLLGLMLGIAVIVLAFLFVGQLQIGLTVGISLLCISLIAATTGAALPFLFHSFGFDPALMSAPFITTVVDILGIIIYLSIATVLLGLHS